MPIRRVFLFALSLLCGLFAVISAVAEAPSDSPFIIDSWSAEEGLPDNEINSIVQTKDGYLWIGTFHGLARFDGNQFTVFDEMNTPALKSNHIVFLYEDSQSNLWVGTQSSGLAMIHNGKIKSFESETAIAGPVACASEDASGLLFYWQNGIALYRDGKINFHPYSYSPQLYLRAQHLYVPSKDGGVWQLWNGEVQKWKGNQLVKNFGRWPWKTRVTATSEDNDGNLIVGTLGEGIFWFDANGSYQHLSKTDGLSSDVVLSLSFDYEGNLWVGTAGYGLNRIKRKIFNSPEKFYPWAVQSMSEDAAGGFWAAITSAGAFYWQSNFTRVFPLEQSAAAWAVLVDRQQRTWVGAKPGGLFLLRTNRFFPVLATRTLGLDISALFESRDGRLWVGSGNGLGSWDGQSWKLFTTHDGLSENTVCAIAEDPHGSLWVGTEKSGLNFFNGTNFISIPATNLPGSDISCLYVDSDGVLWIGTSAHGLARLEKGKWKPFSTRDGLASNSIGYIIGDDVGNLWVGSNAGLMRIPKKSFEASSSETNSLSCRIYGRSDGLLSRECSSGSQPAAIRAHDGKLWFPTIEGVVYVDPSVLKLNPRPPQVFIEEAFVDKQQQNTNPLNSAWSPAVTIPPGREQLEIHYTALNFSAPQSVRFKYRLEGHNWIDAGNSRVARYTGLAPGHYRFNVIACNEDGVWNNTGAVMDIDALPQFWQTGTFQIIVVLLVLAVIVAIVRYLSTQKLHREVQAFKQQEALERERARIARDLHDQLGANLTQVALLGEMAEADKNLPEEVESHSQQISQTARETTRSLDEIVWAVNPSNDTLEGLANYACKYASEYLSLAHLPCRVDVPAQLPAAGIPPEVRHNVFLAFKEAVHNVIKHAQASEVWVRLHIEPKQFVWQVEDNGRGIGKQEASTRNGLRNMKKRMTDIGGDFSISPRAGGGTLVQLTVPLNIGKNS